MAGQIRVEVEGLGTLEFPDGTDPSVIDATVKREVAAKRATQPRTVEGLRRIEPSRAGLGPVTTEPPAAEPTTAPDPRSGYARAVDVATTPLVPQIAAGARTAAHLIDRGGPSSGGLGDLPGAFIDATRGMVTNPIATARGAVAGAVEGTGQVLSQLTSPLDAVLTATGLRSLRAAAPIVSRGTQIIGNTALAFRGGERMADAETPSDAALGLLQASLGAAGARATRLSPRHATGRQDPRGGTPDHDPAAPAAPPTNPLDEVIQTARTGPDVEVPLPPRPRPGDPGDVPDNPVARRLEAERRAVDAPVARPIVNLQRRKDIQSGLNARDAFSEPSRLNAIRTAADTGEILSRPTTATPRVIEGLTRRQSMASEAVPTREAWEAQPLEELPAVKSGALSPMDAGFLKWLAEDLREHTFERGGLSPGQLRDMYDQGAMEFRPAPHSAGTPTQHTFAALGVDATRPELRTAITNLLQGKSRGGVTEDAALKYVAVMKEAWNGDTFDWTRVSQSTLDQLGLRSRKEFKSPLQPPEFVFEGQGPETRQFFARATRTGETDLIPSDDVVQHGLERMRPSEAVRQVQPMRDPLADFEPFVQRLPEHLRPGVRQVLVDNQGFADQRRQTMPFGVTDRLARQLSVDVSSRLPRGTALNSEQLRAYANAVATTGQKVKTLTDKVHASAATDADLVALEAARSEHAVVMASIVGARTEAGRALSSFRMFSKVLETGDTNLIRAVLKAPGVRSGAEDLARQLAAIGDDPVARYRFLEQHAQPTFGDKFRSYYYANILSGVKTHERNILGNLFNSLTNLATAPVAGAADLARSRVTGQPRTAFAGELPAQLMGGVIGTARGMRDFVFTMRHGISPRVLSGTLDAATSQGRFDLPRVELGGGGANPFNWPGRALDAADAFFRSIAKGQEWYGLAYAQAKREGLSGQRLVDRIASLKVEDSPLAQSMDQQAATFATRAVFQEEPGAVARWLQRGSQAFPPLAFVIPFIKTPANILRQGMEFSPAGAVMSAARQPGRAGSQARARVALGSMLMAPLAWLAATGRLSGSGPQDPAERAGKMEAGWRPNAVKLRLSPAMAQQLSTTGGLSPAADGEYWVSYALFQPVSVQASIVANAFEAWQGQEEKGPPSVSTIAAATMRTGRSVLDQSYLSGLFDVLEAIDNPDAWASRYLARVAHSLTPFAGAQRSVQQASDPTVRQPKGFTESFATNVPGLSSSVPARIDRFGEEITRPGHAGMRAADPFNISPAATHPVAQELERLGIDVSLPNARIELQSGRMLSREEEQQVRRARGRAVAEQLAALIGRADYQRLDDDRKRQVVMRAIERSRGAATRQLKAQLP